ncbi:hypothetical protein [Vitiosangium sp. GDMCC 1.1324]|uniref:hypothetical protein n=1 Tax=Vitiosangium sp. (strain GDMCC 1.1324) TaxID=2138576 RepID=UPI000D3C6C6B|nr:hypothetical protein [Vitiosangium sp. GDMCC 1.1324]PTL80716.1 hypothetical protein DAT35_25500 [Vitiosangium sp. GDMCC 1.1324]
MAAPFGASAGLGALRLGECKTARSQWESLVQQKKEEATQRTAALARAEAERRQAHQQRVAELRRAPYQSASLLLTNAYTESLFRVLVVWPDSEETFSVGPEFRIPTATTYAVPSGLQWREGQQVVLRIGVMSLGTWTDFPDIAIEPRSNGTLNVMYDWDTATAKFRLRTEWVELGASSAVSEAATNTGTNAGTVTAADTRLTSADGTLPIVPDASSSQTFVRPPTDDRSAEGYQAARSGDGADAPESLIEAKRRAIEEERAMPGMTPDEVEEALGDPCEKSVIETAESQREVWTWCRICPKTKRWLNIATRAHMDVDCVGAKHVTFVNGVVVEVQR